jgi:hypothetical protein
MKTVRKIAVQSFLPAILIMAAVVTSALSTGVVETAFSQTPSNQTLEEINQTAAELNQTAPELMNQTAAELNQTAAQMGGQTTQANQTTSEMGQNVSNTIGNASVLAQNVTPTSNMSSVPGNESSGNQSNPVNLSAGAVGSSEQLSQILGNNTQVVENKTAIGSAPGPIGNLTASTNTTLGQLGQNASEVAPGLLNKTGEVAKKIIGGAADVLTNITSEVKEGVGAK